LDAYISSGKKVLANRLKKIIGIVIAESHRSLLIIDEFWMKLLLLMRLLGKLIRERTYSE
jgi:hypothetical protein